MSIGLEVATKTARLAMSERRIGRAIAQVLCVVAHVIVASVNISFQAVFHSVRNGTGLVNDADQ